MDNNTIRQRGEQCLHAVRVAIARQGARSDPRSRVRRSQSRPRRWALVGVWDGAVLATYDDETSACDAMTRVDDDDVVVLFVAT
jgi:hypothetical protein